MSVRTSRSVVLEVRDRLDAWLTALVDVHPLSEPAIAWVRASVDARR